MIIIALLVLVLAAALPVWIIVSWCNTVKSDEVVVRRFWGGLGGRVIRPRRFPLFVPYFWGIDLFHVRTKPFQLTYRAKPEDRLISQDGKPITDWEATLYLVLPHIQDELPSIRKMAKAGLNMDEAAMMKLLEDLIVPALSEVVSTMDYAAISGRRNLVGESKKATDALREDPKGVLQMTGIAGSNPKEEEEGTGFIRLTIEHAYNERITGAEEGARAAEATKRERARLIVGPLDEAMRTWVESQMPVDKSKTYPEVMAELVASGTYAKHEGIVKDLILADGGNLAVAKAEIGGPGGQQLPAGLQYLSIGSGGNAGILVGGRGTPRKFDDRRRDGGEGEASGDREKGTPGAKNEAPSGQPSPSWIKRHGGKTS